MINTALANKPKRSIPQKRPDVLRSRQVMADIVEPLSTKDRAALLQRDALQDEVDREIVDELKQLSAERDQQERQVELIPIEYLRRHPKNRVIDANDPSIQTLSESIKANGQLDPLRVRILSDGFYQIISGERRFTAINVAGLDRARCLVVNIDEAAALREVAVANSNREDLNPVQRAELMQELMKPKDKGGSGLSLTDAGKLFGLNSESGAKNALRILKLPEKVRSMVASRELPERVARALIPYTACPPVMNQIVKELESDVDGTGYELTRDNGSDPWWLRQAIEKHTRPITSGITHNYGWDKGQFGCLFDWEVHEKELQIIDLPHRTGRKRTEAVRYSLNVKLWDKLNAPLVKEAIAKKRKEHERGGSKQSSSAKAKKLTPAEEKAEAKRRAKEAEDRLDTFSRLWVDRLLRCSTAEEGNDDGLVQSTLPWLVCQAPTYDLRRAYEQALVECQILAPKGKQLSLSSSMPIVAATGISRARHVACTFWRIILWPVSRLIGDQAKKSELTPAGELPDKIMSLGDSVRNVAAMAAVTIESAWRDGTVDDSDQRRLISTWLMRHTTAQLQALTVEIPTGSVSPRTWSSREQLAAHILAAHKSGKPLPVPKRLQKLFK